MLVVFLLLALLQPLLMLLLLQVLLPVFYCCCRWLQLLGISSACEFETWECRWFTVAILVPSAVCELAVPPYQCIAMDVERALELVPGDRSCGVLFADGHIFRNVEIDEGGPEAWEYMRVHLFVNRARERNLRRLGWKYRSARAARPGRGRPLELIEQDAWLDLIVKRRMPKFVADLIVDYAFDHFSVFSSRPVPGIPEYDAALTALRHRRGNAQQHKHIREQSVRAMQYYDEKYQAEFGRYDAVL
jgi:hypothetical protein